MRSSIFAIGLLSLFFVGCGEDGEDPCPVFAVLASVPGSDTVSDPQVEFSGSCTKTIGEERFHGATGDMTLYLNGSALPRGSWEATGTTGVSLFGTYSTREIDLSVSYGCTAKKLVKPKFGCGYESADFAP